MPARTARLCAMALAVFFLAQHIPLLAFAQNAGDQACCCKDKAASCCRRSHHGASGIELSSREYCGGCLVWIRHSQPVTAIVVDAGSLVEFVVAVAPRQPVTRIASAPRDAVLFERPPPSFVL